MSRNPVLSRASISVLLLLAMQPVAAAYRPDLSSLQRVPMYSTPLAATRTAVQTAVSAGNPHRFAVALPLPLSTSEGRWTQASNGEAVWRLRVHSSQARMLSLALSDVHLPPGARLYFYDTGARLVRGPYTAADLSSDGRLWTPLVNGDSAVLEARMPAAEEGAFSLRLAKVDHAYRSLADGSLEPAAQTASSCARDVACPAGEDWQNQARAVAMISIGGTQQCTATLINDALQDGRPWLLTANHCGVDSAPSLPASSVVVYWNYRATACAGDSASMTETQTGSTLVAHGENADFALLRLNQLPDPDFDVYYAGWDARNLAPESGACIHHPLGAPAKINLFNSPAQATEHDFSTGGGAPLQHVQVWELTWSVGATAAGSSGAPLFDQNQVLVGTLSGGNSACTGTSVSSSGPDYFGRFTVAFPALKPYLDPQNLEVIAVGGKDAGGPDAPVVQGTLGGGSAAGSADPWLLLLLTALLPVRRRCRCRKAASA